MAKITPSSLITAIQGKFNADTFQLWKSAICRKSTGKPHQVNSEARQRFKNVASEIAGRWATLTDEQQGEWDTYAGFLPTSMSGFNAFLARNSALVYANHPSLCYFASAPACYYIPSTPSPLSISWLSGDEVFCVQWTTPSGLSHFVQIFMAPQPGYSNKKFPSTSLKKTEASGSFALTVDGSEFPAGTILHFKARTIDIYGSVSSFSNITTSTRE